MTRVRKNKRIIKKRDIRNVCLLGSSNHIGVDELPQFCLPPSVTVQNRARPGASCKVGTFKSWTVQAIPHTGKEILPENLYCLCLSFNSVLRNSSELHTFGDSFISHTLFTIQTLERYNLNPHRQLILCMPLPRLGLSHFPPQLEVIRKLKTALAKKRIPYFDIWDSIPQRIKSSHRRFFGRDIYHYSPAVYHITAHIVSREITNYLCSS